MHKMISVAIHDGKFHADEVIACTILKLVFKDIKIIRTRDEEILNKCDFRVDIGNKYNPKTNDFDHHQIEGAGKRENGIPYASCGLIWNEFGMNLCVDKDMFDKIDKNIIEIVDAEDNGMKVDLNSYPEIYYFYHAIDSFVPEWNSKKSNDKAFNEIFKIMIKLFKQILIKEKAVSLAKKRLLKRINNNKDEKYLILDKHYPWKELVIKKTNYLFVLFPKEDKSAWNVNCVPIKLNSFENRITLPEEWCGLRDKELAKVSGIDDAIFCHRNGFLFVCKTKKSAIKAVKKTLAINNIKNNQ